MDGPGGPLMWDYGPEDTFRLRIKTGDWVRQGYSQIPKSNASNCCHSDSESWWCNKKPGWVCCFTVLWTTSPMDDPSGQQWGKLGVLFGITLCSTTNTYVSKTAEKKSPRCLGRQDMPSFPAAWPLFMSTSLSTIPFWLAVCFIYF